MAYFATFVPGKIYVGYPPGVVMNLLGPYERVLLNLCASSTRTPIATLQRDKIDLQCGDGANGGTRVLPDGCIGGEVVEGGGAAVAFVGQGVSPGTEVGKDDCGPGRERDDTGESCGGGGAVSAEGGDVDSRTTNSVFSGFFLYEKRIQQIS